MVRAAAKNHGRVGVVVHPGQYEEVAAAIEGGGLDDDLRLRLAREAFFRTARYDAAIRVTARARGHGAERATIDGADADPEDVDVVTDLAAGTAGGSRRAPTRSRSMV